MTDDWGGREPRRLEDLVIAMAEVSLAGQVRRVDQPKNYHRNQAHESDCWFGILNAKPQERTDNRDSPAFDRKRIGRKPLDYCMQVVEPPASLLISHSINPSNADVRANCSLWVARLAHVLSDSIVREDRKIVALTNSVDRGFGLRQALAEHPPRLPPGCRNTFGNRMAIRPE
jgi:hypothetical protein